jgi:hypothetical protein
MKPDKNLSQGPVLVVISHYNARPIEDLLGLLETIHSLPAGWPFHVRIVVNQELPTSLRLPRKPWKVEVLYRQNAGYNIGAWDFGWRISPKYQSYLFLQEECRVVREGWLKAFVEKASDSTVGLIGECFSVDWNHPWEMLAEATKAQGFEEHMVDGKPVERVPCYLNFLQRHGIPPSSKADHLQSLVMFVRREIIEAMRGFPVGTNFGEAVAAEIGISKKIQALGLKTCQVAEEPFTYLHHPQWLFRKYEYKATRTQD